MKKFIMALVCLMTMVIGFTSCSSNDEKNPPIETSIIGTWESNDGEYICITFSEGNKYTLKTSHFSTNGNFIIENNEILWNDSHISNATIISLTKTELVLRFNSTNDVIAFKRKS